MKKCPKLPGTLPAKQSKQAIIPAFIFFAAMLVTILPGKLFAQAPAISSFNPATGSVGTLVTINGTNLTTPTALTIGGQNAIAVSNTGRVLVAMVMPGAVTGKVSITNTGGTATSGSSFTVTATPFPSAQQGSKLVGTGNSGTDEQGYAVAISADGNTAIVGGPNDNSLVGAAWVYTRSGGIWTQQGTKLVGTGNVGFGFQGVSVSLSADGNTAIVGGCLDNSEQGAAWVYTRSGGVWTQQGSKLVGTGGGGTDMQQGRSVSLSADGNTALVGGFFDNTDQGAAWVYTRSNGVWTQQGTKLVGTGSVGAPAQGVSVSLSADGNTAIVGGPLDNSLVGAAWVYTRSGGIWTQQGTKLVGTGGMGTPVQGESVSLSADGNTAIVGGTGGADADDAGAAWIFIRSGGAWAQQGSMLVGSGNIGASAQGIYVSLSADGNTAIVGGNNDNNGVGAAWVYTRNNGAWTQQGSKLVGTGAIGAGGQGTSVALSADGSTAMVGAWVDNSDQGAAWVFTTSSNALLSTIVLTPDSAQVDTITVSNATTYTASFGNANNLLTITPTAQNVGAVIKVNGVIVTNGTASASIALPVGKTSINVTVTSQDGTATKTYSLIITRAQLNPLDNLGLTTSTPAAGAYSLRLLSSSYKGPLARITIGTNYYDVYPDASKSKKLSLKSQVSRAYTSYNATATGATGNSLHNVIKGQSATVATWYDQSGNSNDAIQGTTSIQPEIINNGAIDMTNALPVINFLGANYLVVTSTQFNNDLSGSVVFNATNANNTPGPPAAWPYMNGIFGSEQPFYVNDFGYGILNNVFTAGNGPNDNSVGGATIVDDGTTRVNSWTRNNSSGNVALYANKAADGSGALNNGTRSAVPSVAIGAITTSGGGDFNGTMSELTVFPTVYTLAQRQTIEGNQATYYGIKSADAALAIVLSAHPAVIDTVVNGNITTYTAFAGNAISSIKFTPIAQDPTATINVNGKAVTSGTVSGNIHLAVGTDTIATIVATAQDGITTQTYLLIINREAKPNPLDNLGLTNSTPAAGAYSLRLLSSSYKGPLVRITIGANYYDVYPDASNSKKLSLKSPVSVAYTSYNAAPTGATGNLLHSIIKGQSATVATWYDQGGNGNDAIQATTSIQPEIINNGAIDMTNALPVIKFLGANYLVVTSTEFNNDLSGSVVFNATNANNISGPPAAWPYMNGIFGSEQPFYVNDFGYGILNNVFTGGNGPADNSVGGATVVDDGTTRVNSWTRENSSGNVALYANKAADGSGALNNGTRSAVPSVAIGAITTSGGGDFNGTMSELTVFPTVYTLTQRQTIEGNQATYYGIKSADAALAIVLSAHPAVIDTVVNGNITTYTAFAGNAISSIKFTPIAQDPTATIKVNGKAVTSGTVSGNIHLAVGTDTIATIAATAQDGITTQTYLVIINREAKPNPLDNLGLTTSTPAAGAYSLRLLSNSYKGPLARITIGANYYDVYPDASNGRKFSLKSPVSKAYTSYNATSTGAPGNSLHNVINGKSATVATWYDQSGNSNDAVQATTSIQPEIINNGSIDMTNALPVIKFLGANYLVVTSTQFNNDLSGSVVFNATNANNISGPPAAWPYMNGIFGSEQPFYVNDFGYGILNNVFTGGNGPNDNSVGGATVVDDGTTRVNSWTRTNSSGDVALYANKAADGSGALNNGGRTAVPSVAIGAITTSGGGDFNGTISELTVFPAVYSLPERQTIEGNQATYYGILSANAALTSITLTPNSALTDTVTVGNVTTYNASVSNFITSVKVTPTTQDAAATIQVNGVTVKSGTASHSIALAVGQTTITTVVTAQDGITNQTYSITVTRATGPLHSLYVPVSVVQALDSLKIENDGILVHQGVSPNGDGLNDVLTIDGITAYPDNKLTVIDRSGAIIFEAKGYNNISNVFDGHSKINGRMQQPGTYFYSLDYVADGQRKHKTGFILLKY